MSLLRALAAALCASLVAIVWLMASCAEGRRIASARQRASDACEAIASHYMLSLPHATEPNVQLLGAERARIVEPFVSARPGGCGLGLTLVREIAASHGGNACHAATPTTCFVIDIPWRPSC
ncbi:hypothetical protein [Burkholderia sp. AU39826]|uniref:hypothetical protein n=1 Tax=Burkholderia sp. AU39826 TaxID=2879634 RepID=UPI00299F3047|nr:hypothetical protein [Burkholderia sp. AU39826]